jgi:hypothetical protein
VWEALVAACGVRDVNSTGATGDSTGTTAARAATGATAPPGVAAPATAPAKPPKTAKEKMLLAQHYVNMGEHARALGVYGASPVGDGANPAVQRALLDLTPYHELPPPEVTAPVEGVRPLAASNEVIDKVVRRLPCGRARGTLMTNYELIVATHADGAAEGWHGFFRAFAAGALACDLAALMRALRAVMLAKDDTGVNYRRLASARQSVGVGARSWPPSRRRRGTSSTRPSCPT